MANEAGPGGTASAEPPPTSAVDADETHGIPLGLRIQHLLHSQATLGPLAVLVVAVVAFAILSPNVVRPGGISTILGQVTVVGILAIGQTLVILTAGIDLSVGAMMVLTLTMMAWFSSTNAAQGIGLPGPVALIAGLALGAVLGLVNGLLVTRLKLPAFIVTLGTYYLFFAVNLKVSASATVRGADMPEIMTWAGNTFNLGELRIPYGAILMLLLVGAFAYALRLTAWGKHVYATGDDTEAARLAGIRTDRVLVSVFLLAGILAAVAGWALMGRLGSSSPQAGQTENLDSITAVVIGGTSMFGGRGRVVEDHDRRLIVGVFRFGLVQVGVEDLWQMFATGILIIVAVSLDQWIRTVKG
jgi:fructose transport system permease protein